MNTLIPFFVLTPEAARVATEILNKCFELSEMNTGLLSQTMMGKQPGQEHLVDEDVASELTKLNLNDLRF